MTTSPELIVTNLPPFTAEQEAALRETLKRCSPATAEAVCHFRRTGDLGQLPIIIAGVIERFVERERRAKLQSPADELRLVDDLGVDSLTMMEIVLLAEEALQITISNEELCRLRTFGEVRDFIACKIRGLPPPGKHVTIASGVEPSIAASSAK